MSRINYTNSLLASIVIYSLVSYLFSLPGWLTGILFAIIGSQISWILPDDYKSSLLCLLPLVAAAYWYPIIFLPVGIGYLASILVALLSKGGCKLLYPIAKTTFTGPANYLEVGSKEDKSATTFLVVLAILAIIFSMFGNEILADINENEGILEYYTHRADGTSYASSSGGNGYGGNARYGENNSGYIHYVYIDTSKHAVNRNITTYNYDNNTTTTIISEYKPPIT
ncbi:MAG: hypothetical protein BZ138_07810 [Methanosphaera sp. rholeuAM270]|nr:MAG: hypothetical protein BZ138_07810 [Methanosphaera sp. rholeuAM270]